MNTPIVKKGTCADCIEMQKKVPDYCCLFCALGLKKEVDAKPGKNGSVVIDLSDPNHPFWGKPKESARLAE